MNPGLLIVVSGPAGVGKGTIVRKMLEKNSKFVLSVSATSRAPRPNESEGNNYYYKTREQFEAMIKNDELIEWVEYCDNYYGTPRELVLSEIEKGNVVLLEIEVDGALNVKRLFPDCVLCFIIPPDFNELEKRLRGRGTDTEEAIIKRLTRAKEEFRYLEEYDYLIINDSIENAAQRFFSIVQAEQMRTKRNQSIINKFKNI
ncbi:MAG TPA: guanylate kinase [Clostridiaceae bacterium]|jgi:guanylate kinase|nr:guanylate kinase [Clostridiaceae bacterium]